MSSKQDDENVIEGVWTTEGEGDGEVTNNVPKGTQSAHNEQSLDLTKPVVPRKRRSDPIPAQLKQGRLQDRSVAVEMQRFLAHYRQSGSIGRSCEATGIMAVRIAQLRRNYPWFNVQIQHVRAGQLQMIEDTAMRLATSGEDPVTTRWMLERLDPETYAAKKGQSDGGSALTITVTETVYDAI